MPQYKKKVKKEFRKVLSLDDGNIGFDIAQLPESASIWKDNKAIIEERSKYAKFFMSKLYVLSPREKEIVIHLIDGISIPQIALLLSISKWSVKDYKNRAITKLKKLAPFYPQNGE